MTDTDAKEECSAMVISRSGVGHVAVCTGCGNVHLTMEYLTVRLQPGAFAELAGMLADARRKIDTAALFHPEPVADVPADEKVH